jgi:hypothetical protein
MMTLIQYFMRRRKTEVGRREALRAGGGQRLSSMTLRLGAVLVVALALIGMVPAQPALAQAGDSDVTVTNGSYTLEAGDSIAGNLVVFGGVVEIEEGATIGGDVVVFGGATEIAGEVGGSITQLGGSLELMDGATVGGDINRAGGSYDQAEGASIGGSINEGMWNLDRAPGFGPDVFVAPPDPDPTGFDLAWGFFWQVTEAILWTFGVSLLAVLIVSFLPKPVSRVRLALADAPVLSLGVGLLTLVAVIVVLVVMVVTCVLIPITPIAALALAAGWLLGMTAVGQLVGERVAVAVNLQSGSPAVIAGAGTALVMVLTYAISAVTCGGWLIWPVVSAIGLGAVALTRFGRQPYPDDRMPPVAPAPPALFDPQI